MHDPEEELKEICDASLFLSKFLIDKPSHYKKTRKKLKNIGKMLENGKDIEDIDKVEEVL